MTWHPVLNPFALTLLVLAGLAVMALSFAWSSRELKPWTPQGLIVIALRGAAFLMLLLVVLQPYRLPEPREIDAKRTFAVLIDASGSMSTRDDPAGPPRIERAAKLLTEHKVFARVCDVANLSVYSFDGQPAPLRPEAITRLAATGKMTDLAASLERVVRQHQGDDLAGLLLVTDGRNTQGADPSATAAKLKVPLFVLAVGEEPRAGEARKKEEVHDLAVESVSNDPRIIVGRTAQVVVTVSGRGYPARQVTVELLENDRPVNTTAVAISPRQNRRQALFAVSPTALGFHQYQVRVPAEEGEADPGNNTATFKIEVVDPVNRLIYLDRLRSERRFLKPVLEARKSLRFTAVVQQDQRRVLVDGNDAAMKKEAANFSPAQLAGVKAVIIGDLPATAISDEQAAALADWVDKGGALMMLAGPASMGEHGFVTTPLAQVLPVTVEPGTKYLEHEFTVELTPDGAAHPAFQKVKGRWARAAPLLSRFAVTSVKPAATVLMDTADGEHAPVVVSHTYGHGRAAIVLTDSTWRWQLASQGADATNTEHAVFWKQMIDWLLPDMDSRGAGGSSEVQLIADRAEYEVNDQVVLMASVRGGDGGVVRNAVVEIEAATPDGRPIRRTAQLEPGLAGGAYTATFDVPAAGQYEVHAVAKLGEQTLGSDQITLHVTQPVIEFTNTDPDRPLLKSLAQASGGQYLEPADLDRIVTLARLSPRKIQIQNNAEKDATPAWDRWWLGLILLTLMASEWALRKHNQWV